jgi:hypothetical protein
VRDKSKNETVEYFSHEMSHDYGFKVVLGQRRSVACPRARMGFRVHRAGDRPATGLQSACKWHRTVLCAGNVRTTGRLAVYAANYMLILNGLLSIMRAD